MSADFAFEARSRDGRLVAGTLAAASRAEAIDTLHARTLFVTSLVRAGSPRGVLFALRAGTSIGSSRVTTFRSLATLVRAGVALRRALEIVCEQCPSARVASAVAGVAVEIERGARFSEALKRYPREFPDIVSSLVRAGEVSGALDDALDRIAELLERGYALKREIFAALAYPGIVALLAVGLVLFLTVAVVPEMATMLRGFGTPLPPATAVLIASATALREPGVDAGLLLTAFAGAIAAVVIYRTPGGAAFWDRVRFAVPIFGRLARNAEVAACARTFGTTLRCGVAMDGALGAAASMTRSARLRRAFEQVGEAVALGQRVTPAFAASGLFDPVFLGLVRAGEESGALDAMLVRAADHLEIQVRTATAALSTVIEPLMIVFLGGAIAAIVAAVLVPLYSTIGSIT